MTAKSRRRKLDKKMHASASNRLFTFSKGIGITQIEADNEHTAKLIFQERYGYWPE